MGRYATRRIRGGGERPPTQPIQMINATIIDPNTARVTWDGIITGSTITAIDFASFPSTEPGDTFNLISDTQAEIGFVATIDTDTELQYGGSAVNVITPQTIAYT